ncbi:hypothetical protein Tco_0023959 [Tanacetum coccineum]
MNNPNLTMKEYIMLEEEKARKHGKVFIWKTAMYGKIWDNEDVYDLASVETEFPAIVFNDMLTSEATLSCVPTVSFINNDEIDFRISFDESDDEDCMVIFDKKSFSYKIISVNDLKTDSKNNNDKVNMHFLPPPEPTVSCFDDLDFFKDFENEFPAIVHNNALTSKSDFLTEPTISPQHIDEFNLKDETPLSECDEEERNVLNFNDLFPFNVIYPNDSKSDKDNDDDKVDIEHSLEDLSVKPLPDVINTDDDFQIYGAVIPDGMINDDINLSKAYKTYLDYAIGKVPKKARKFKKPASPKIKIVPTSPKEPTQKGKRVKRPAKKANTAPTTVVFIRDTPDKSVSKNKAPSKIGRGKGIKGSSEGANFESKIPDEQTDKPKDTNKGTSEKPRVHDVSKDDSTDSEAESWGDSKDESDDVNDKDDDDDNGYDDNSNDSDDGGYDDGGNKDDYEENPPFTLKDYEDEEQDEEYVFTPEKDKSDDKEKMYEEEYNDVTKELYGYFNITQGLRDTNMTNAEQGTMQSSSISSDFTSKLLNLDNTSPDVNEIASLMNTVIVPPLPPHVNPYSHLTTTPQQ